MLGGKSELGINCEGVLKSQGVNRSWRFISKEF